MNACPIAAALLLLLGIAFLAPSAHGTNDYDYKPGETLVIDHGLSPDKQFSIAGGADGKGEFHLYLVDAKSKKRIGPLTEMTDMLDTGADSLHATWAPDSRHVAITYRISHQESVLFLYRIENRRAFLVTGPKDLLPEIKGIKTAGLPEPYTISFELKWLNAARFTLRQEGQYNHSVSKPSPVLQPYVSDLTEESGDDDGDAKGKKQWSFYFTADGDCELTGADKFRVTSVRPVPGADR